MSRVISENPWGSAASTSVASGDVVHMMSGAAPSGYLKMDGLTYLDRASYPGIESYFPLTYNKDRRVSDMDAPTNVASLSFSLTNMAGANGKLFYGTENYDSATGSTTGENFVSSDDGATWTLLSGGGAPIGGLFGGVYIGTNYVLGIGTGTISSSNLTTWSAQVGAFAAGATILYDIISAAGYAIVCGVRGTAAYGCIQHSTNGTSWTTVALSAYSTAGYGPRSLAQGANVFVTVGNNGTTKLIHTSPSTGAPATWTSRTVPTLIGLPQAVSWCGDRFVMTTTANEIVTSPDGITWTKQIIVSAILPPQGKIAYCNGIYVGKAKWSKDLTTWYRTDYNLFRPGPNFATDGKVFGVLTRPDFSMAVGYDIPNEMTNTPANRFFLPKRLTDGVQGYIKT